MIPFFSLENQLTRIRKEIDEAIAGVLDSCQFVLGDEVCGFEQEFAAYCGTDYSVAVNSGTSALHLALLAAGVGVGDEVITVSHTFVATIAAICYTGATPVYVDIDENTANIDARLIEQAITKRTKAIVPVHLYGQPADMNAIMNISKNYGLAVIEDAAQAHGAEYLGQRVGSIGDMACFSFYPGKSLGACGEGGAVTTSNREYAEKIRLLRDWGANEKYKHDILGYNYRMEGIQGAILRVKLQYLDGWVEARIRHAGQYSAGLAKSNVRLLNIVPNALHSYHLYVVMVDNRERFQGFMFDNGVQTSIHYPVPVHEQKGYQKFGRIDATLPKTEKMAREVVSLPMFPELTAEQIEAVVDAIKNYS
jgi:dTDP-4-amino-4,6-dideoxygalactose transaminase